MISSLLLLFDLGGVLIESAAFENLNRLLPETVLPNHIKEHWLRSPSVRQYERGQASAAEFANRFVKEWQLTISADAFLEEFATWPRAFFPGAKELIRELRQYYRVGCLSNSNPLQWAIFEDELATMFDIILCSHQLGSIKPDQDIFERAIQESKTQPREIYFFDDCLINVRAAQNLDINAFCVTGISSLVPILQIQGLLAIPESVGVFCNA